MRIGAIIFDFDGVIVDSERVHNAALAEVLTGAGHPTSVEEAIARYTGLRWTDCHARIVAETGLAIGCTEFGDMLDAVTEARAAEIIPLPGLEPFLAAQAHRPLAIASSSERGWLLHTLDRLGLRAHFQDRVFSAAHLPRGKPHPDIYLQAAAALGIAAADCLVIEDHPIGITAAVAAGMTVIGLLAASHIGPGHEQKARAAGARHVAHSYLEVADLVRQIEAN